VQGNLGELRESEHRPVRSDQVEVDDPTLPELITERRGGVDPEGSFFKLGIYTIRQILVKTMWYNI
jgi:hypothetical protein